jgi:hypothetical protein
MFQSANLIKIFLVFQEVFKKCCEENKKSSLPVFSINFLPLQSKIICNKTLELWKILLR